MDADTIAVILLCIVPVGVVLLLLGGLIADASPRDSSISKFMHGLLDLFEDNRNRPPVQNYRKGTTSQYKSSGSETTYKSPSQESSVREYKQILEKAQNEWKDKNAVYTGKEQKGKNGGRYRLRETKKGKKYRQYY